MNFWLRKRLVVGVGLLLAGAAGLTPAEVRGQAGKGGRNGDPVEFETYDGVKLAGTFYPHKTGTKRGVVLLLHNFDPRKGTGNSSADGMDDFAEKLQAAGYAVLRFDFRGFGES